MKKLIYLLAVAALGAGACSEQGLPTYGGDRYVYFVQKSDEIVRFSFKTTPGKDERTIRLAVETVSRTPDETLGYKLEIDPEKTTAPAGSYDLDPNPVIPARIVLRRNLRPGPQDRHHGREGGGHRRPHRRGRRPTGPAPRPTVCVSSAFRTSSPSPTGGTTISPPPSWAIIRTRNTRSSSRPPA